MKFTVTFKTPDVLDQVESENMQPCAEHLAKDEWGDEDCNSCVEAEEREQDKRDLMKACAEKFVKWGEYVTIEFDTDANTATVVKL